MLCLLALCHQAAGNKTSAPRKTTRRVTMMQSYVCAAPCKQNMSYGMFCQPLSQTQDPKERNTTRLVTGELKYITKKWESVLLFNICDTGKKSHKQPESCNSKERVTWCERRQKQEAVARLTQEHVTGCSVKSGPHQDRLERNITPYSKMLNAKRKLGKKRPVVPWDMNTEGLQCLSETTQKANSRTKRLSYSQVF